MSKVDIMQFPGHIFAKIVIYSACVAKSRCGEDKIKFFFDLFEKLKTLFKNPLWVFNIINMVYTIYVPSLNNYERVQRLGLCKVTMSSPQRYHGLWYSTKRNETTDNRRNETKRNETIGNRRNETKQNE